MCKSHRIESFLEPLLSNLFDTEDDLHKNNRGDLILPGLDGSFISVDVMSVDPCNVSNERLANSEIHDRSQMLKISNSKNTMNLYQNFQPTVCKIQFASICIFSIWFNCSHCHTYLADCKMIVKRRTNRNFNRLFWQNRIVFSILKGMLKMVSDAFLSLGSHYERFASSVFVLGEMDYLDVDLLVFDKKIKKRNEFQCILVYYIENIIVNIVFGNHQVMVKVALQCRFPN
ncbi:hypothetical protein P9112_014213 [Eukaryota sp. TZLM1-RC]